MVPDKEVTQLQPLVNRLNVVTGLSTELMANSILKSDNKHILIDNNRDGTVWVKRNLLNT